MNARPQFHDILISQKLLKWCRAGKWHAPALRSRARRNYWRLCAKYPHIMRSLGLTELSVYE